MFRNDSIVKRIIAECITILLVLIVINTLNAQTWSNLQGPIKQRVVYDVGINGAGTTVYAAEKSMLFMSTNSGTTWNVTSMDYQTPLVTVAKKDDANYCVAGFDGDLYWTLNGWSTWYNVLHDVNTKPLRLANSPIFTTYMFLGRKAVSSFSCILRSTNNGLNWSTPATYPTGTNIKDIAPYPTNTDGKSQHVWAVGADPTNAAPGQTLSTRGVWQSTDLGANWTYKTAMREKNITSIAIRPSGPPDLWIGTDDGTVQFSNDEGDSWTEKKYGEDTIRAVRARNNQGTWEIYVASRSALIKTTNNGTNWSTVTLPSGISNVRSFVVATTSSNQSTMFITADNGLWKTTDAGANWSAINDGLGHMAVSAGIGNGTNYWAVMKDQDTISRYDGSSWSNLEISNLYSNDIMRHSNGNLFLSGLYSQKAALYRSTDNGASYSVACTSATQSVGNIFKGSIASPQDASYLYVWGKDGTTANFYKIANYGTGTKEPFSISGSVTNTVNDVALIGTQTLYYGLENAGVYKSTSGPSNGNSVLSGVSVRSLAVNSNATNNVYAAGSFGVKKTTNGGTNWNNITTMNTRRVIMCPGSTASEDHIMFLGSSGVELFYSSNGGTNYTSVVGNLPKPIYDIKAVSGSPAAIYVMTDAGLFKMQTPSQVPTLILPDNNATVGLVTTLSWYKGTDAITSHLLIAKDANFTNIVADINGITGTSYTFASEDGGNYYWKVAAVNYVGESDYCNSRTFTSVASGWIALTKTSYLGADGYFHPRLNWTSDGTQGTYYVYRYSCAVGCDSTAGTWPYELVGITGGTTADDGSIKIKGKADIAEATYWYQVRSVGKSNKVNYVTTEGQIQKTAINRPDNLPLETKLIGSFPNPFNPVTHIQYDLKEDVLVKIVVYDMLGREVEVLVNDVENAGSHDIIFNASQLPSGVYIYRFSAGDYTAMKKLVLTK